MTMVTDVPIPGGGGEAVKPAGDPLRLLEAGFERFYGAVHRYLLHRLFDRERAEELTAETFYRAAGALQPLCSGDSRGSGLLADARQMQMWLLRIATNVANTEYRRAKWRRLLFERLLRTSPVKGRPVADEGDDPQAAKVREALRRLPPRHQAPLVLRYYSQMSFADMAVVLECREGTVRARVSRALRELRSGLGIEQISATKTKRGDQ